jgi:hypothetical protein
MNEREKEFAKKGVFTRKEGKDTIEYLNGIHLDRMKYPVKISSELMEIFEDQAALRAHVMLSTIYR